MQMLNFLLYFFTDALNFELRFGCWEMLGKEKKSAILMLSLDEMSKYHDYNFFSPQPNRKSMSVCELDTKLFVLSKLLTARTCLFDQFSDGVFAY